MLYALVFDMPVKTGLKLMAPIGSDHADPERKLFYDIIDELDCTILGMFRINLQCPNTCCIVNGSILVPLYCLSFPIFQLQKLHNLVKAGEDVYLYDSEESANWNYRIIKQQRLVNRSQHTVTNWQTPDWFNFSSSVATQWHFACATSNFSPTDDFGSSSKNCQFLGQYEEFVILFGITTEVDDTVFVTNEDILRVVEAGKPTAILI